MFLLDIMITKGVVIIPTHGFGNRLKIIASAHIFCKQYKLPLLICWQQTPDCNIKLSDVLTNQNSIEEISFDDLQKSKYCYFGQVHTNTLFEKIDDVIDDMSDTYDYLLLEGGHEFKSTKLSRLHFLQEKREFYNNLLFTDDIMNKVRQFKKQCNLEKKARYISIHYRDIDPSVNQSDNQSDSILNFVKNSPIDSFFKTVDKFKVSRPIVIVSNTDKFYKHFKDKYSKQFEIYSRNIVQNDRDSKEDMIDSIVDFIILSQSELVVGSYFSAFSDESTFVNMIPKITPLSPELEHNIVNTVNSYHCLNYSFMDNIAAVNFNDKILLDIMKF